MEPLIGKKTLKVFREQFPFWAMRVVKWRPSAPFEIQITLNDGNVLYFSDTGKRQRLYTSEGKKKGRVVYDSKTDHSKGV